MRQNDAVAKAIVAELRNPSDPGRFEYWHPTGRQKDLPDGVFGYAGFTVLLEFKGDDYDVTKEQAKWHASWLGGPIRVLRTPADAKALKAALLRAAEHQAGLD